MDNRYKYKRFDFLVKIGVICMLSLPLILQVTKFITFTPLNGVQTSKAEAIFDSLNENIRFDNRSFQIFTENKLEEDLVLKSPLIRLRNQIEYSIFNKINAQQIYQYNDQLFRFYVPDYNEGSLFLGEDKIKEKIKKLIFVQDYIGKDHPIITVIAPSKTYFYAEFLPEINRLQTENSNYKKIKKTLISNNLNLIDFNKWFLEIKNKKEAPLFGKGGIHWSLFGATLAMDSLITFMEKEKKNSFQHPNWKLNPKYQFFYNDQDLAQLLNVFNAPNDQSLRLPIFIQSNPKKKKIKALIISDSFFDVVSISPLRNQIFTPDSEYLYYFNSRKDPTNNNQTINKNELVSKMKSVDCIILMNDIVNMENFGWGFIETAYEQASQPSIRH